tara:strand:- start:231 stop:1280 length:1050 start_codon:yes stop_codon:yes gene_type:complete
MLNSVPNLSYLKGMTDEEIRAGIVEKGETIIKRAFPGKWVKATGLADALEQTGCMFEVEKHPLMSANHVATKECPSGLVNDSVGIDESLTEFVATKRTDTMKALSVVGKDYGVVQTMHGAEALDILSKRGELDIVNVESIGGGARIRITALLGVGSFPQFDGAPNTLANFAVFEVCHDGRHSNLYNLYTLRLDCFNGMTSRQHVSSHKLKHTSRAVDRVDAITADILATLLGDVEAEMEMFKALAARRMSVTDFEAFATELLGGEIQEDATDSKKTRRENEMKELVEYFEGGNQGAGPTAYGAYNSVTRWVEAKKEAMADAAKFAKKFESNTNGSNQNKVAKALELLTR